MRNLVLFLCTTALCPAAVIGPSPYLSFSDSPFSGQSFVYFQLENFESGALSTPGVTVTPGATVIGPASQTDSVDGDDGTIDGSGTGGHSLYPNASTISFVFDATALGGNLPTVAGIVWTDVGFVASGATGTGPVSFQAFDATNTLIGTLGPVILGDGSTAGGTQEDRFFGVTNAGGISRISISVEGSTDWEVDHLQYGFQNQSVPEPATWGMISIGGAAALLMRRKLSRRVGQPTQS